MAFVLIKVEVLVILKVFRHFLTIKVESDKPSLASLPTKVTKLPYCNLLSLVSPVISTARQNSLGKLV